MTMNKGWNSRAREWRMPVRSRRGAGLEFEINVSSRYRVGVESWRTWLIGGCVGLLLSIAWTIWQGVLVYGDSQVIQAELERVRHLNQRVMVEASNEGVDLSSGAVQRLSSEVELANQLLKRRTFSWTTFLSELEQTIPSRLALTSIRLDRSSKTVHLTGIAVSLEDITAFTLGLQNHTTFKDPVLAQHRSGASGLVEFDVSVQYRQPGV